MRVLDCDEWQTLGQLYAFFGNSLLSPMNRMETVGLDPAFWHDLAGLLGGAIARPAQDCAAWAERAAGDCSRDELVQRVSVEFTHLFVGPPSPAAPPWESANGPVESHVGFGEATYQMRERLRAVGLAQCGSSNQFEDHLGIELLYLSELCRRIADAQASTCGSEDAQVEELECFVREHPLCWIGRFCDKVALSRPDGYFVHVLDCARTLLGWQVA